MNSPLGIQLRKVVWCKTLCVVHINCLGDPALLVHLQGGGHILHSTAQGSGGLLSVACLRDTDWTIEGGCQQGCQAVNYVQDMQANAHFRVQGESHGPIDGGSHAVLPIITQGSL